MKPNGKRLAAARLEVELVRSWPAMDTRAASTRVLETASARLGREIAGVARGGASDASHFASAIPVTIDGLGPRGGHAHSPEEYVYGPSLRERAQDIPLLTHQFLQAEATRQARSVVRIVSDAVVPGSIRAVK